MYLRHDQQVGLFVAITPVGISVRPGAKNIFSQRFWKEDLISVRSRYFTYYQVLCERSTYLYLGRNMDYENEPNSQNVSIWTQLNDHGRIFNGIGCSTVLEHRTGIFRLCKRSTLAKKRGGQGVNREHKIEQG